MGLPFAPNSVPSGLNPGGRRLTTRIHSFSNISNITQILGVNPNRLCIVVSYKNVHSSGYEQLSVEPDINSSWIMPYSLNTGFTIYGTMSLYARIDPTAAPQVFGIEVLEYVYE